MRRRSTSTRPAGSSSPGTPLDHEAKASYSVTVVAQDSDGESASVVVTIAVTNANEPPLFDPTDDTRNVAENTGPGQAIGDPVAAADPDSGDTLTYRLGGTDAAACNIDSASGQLLTRGRARPRGEGELLGDGGGARQ